MVTYQESLQEESDYLRNTIALIHRQLDEESASLSNRKNKLIAARRDMWENTVHFSSDFARLTEMNQHLNEVNRQSASYYNTVNRTQGLRKMVDSPYFGRFDFIEAGCADPDRIYVGLATLIDPATQQMYVYDWRAPISGMFYRFEPGPAQYQAPSGNISGELLLKRQYKIENSELKYFFDCSIRISDEILQEVLSRNSSPRMRNIVETIQKEQDLIIRDTENELLMVQGTAGSGKTSIALHRVAFLLYEGLGINLDPDNIIIISPNPLFSRYISGVLPELGENNVRQTTVEELCALCFGDKPTPETRSHQLEAVVGCKDAVKRNSIRQSIEFKGSTVFVTILDRLLWEFAHRLLEFSDVYYDGILIETRQQLKNFFLNNKTNMPMAKHLKRLENRLMEKVHPLQKNRLRKLEKIVQQSEGHDLEIKSFSRLLSIRRTKTFMEHIRRFTEVDFVGLYQRLFSDRQLFYRLTRGLNLPDNIEDIIAHTANSFDPVHPSYEDSLPLLYLRLRIEGSDLYADIKQVVVDEAQDYYPLHYELFRLLFGEASFTVLGDVSQSVEKQAEMSLYQDVARILNKPKSILLTLSKSYRASFEINRFTQRLLPEQAEVISFERHEAEPVVIYQPTQELLDRSIVDDTARYLSEGFESAAVICKTQGQAKELYERLKGRMRISLLNLDEGEIAKGTVILPVYLAKGLEFDAVLVCGADSDNYRDDFDKRLLYIACTRALHRLGLYFTGEKCRFI